MRNIRIKPLLLFHLLALALLASLCWQPTQAYWDLIDRAFFKMINGSLRGSHFLQLFWGLANHKYADWLEDVVILGFAIACVKQTPRELRTKKIAEIFFCICYIAFTIYVVNRLVFRENLIITRLSPSLVMEDCVRVTREIPWLSIKDSSSRSFPGDHATTALLFAACFCWLSKWRLGICAVLYAAFLCMPRMITGAHWLSDVLVGSGSIALLFLSWAFYTPLATSVSSGLLRLCNRPRKIRTSR